MKQIFSLLLLLTLSLAGFGYDLVVAKDGSGNYTTVQDAINAAPSGSTIPFTIYIKNGRYKEKITIPSSKPFIHLVGESVSNTILTYDDYAAKLTACSATLGTQNSASFSVNATDFAAFNITFENSYGDGSQAVAVLVNNDRALFINCRFLGNQDTLYVKGSGTPRCYFKSCYIDGNVDFIFGSSVALFDSCVLYAKTRPSAGSSFITAPSTPTGQQYGYVFRDARLPMNAGGTLYFLSRPWPSPSESQTAQKTVFTDARMSSHIQPAGWTVWNSNTITGNILYAEYNSRYFDGTPVNTSARVPWSVQLTAPEAAGYTLQNVLGGWDPCVTAPAFCGYQPLAVAVSNFRVSRTVSSSVFNWNISWPMTGISYTLYRSEDGSSYAPVHSVTATNDTSVNFSHTDLQVPPAGSTWYYYLNASLPGTGSHITDTIEVSNGPSLLVNASDVLFLCGFTQVLGTPSPAQTYTITGNNLTGPVVITPSADFEVSADGINWFTSSGAPLEIQPSAGTLSNRTVYVRLNAAAVDTYTGNIANITAGTAYTYVPVKGRTVPPSVSEVLQLWPLTANAQDNPAVRSQALEATVPQFRNLFLTDGSLPAPSGTIPAYSVNFGQAFGANAAGNNWQAVGGTLRRTHYQEFTITALAGNSVRIDSISFNCNFYATQSGTKMALVYSRNGFGTPADSTEFTDGIGPTGSALTLTASGNFTKSFPIAQNNNGASDYFALALNSNNGVVINGGETLTVRLYWACSSTGTPRYALLKNVAVKGLVLTPVPLRLLKFNATPGHRTVNLEWETTAEDQVQAFEVQRSRDGLVFSPIGQVQANNRAGRNQYRLTDEGLPEDASLVYRLKMINTDGSYTYSPMRRVQLGKVAGIRLVPNLVTGPTILQHGRAEKGAQVEIYSTDGRRVMKLPVQKGTSQTLIDASRLLPGTYQAVFANAGTIQFVPFVKQ